MEVGGKYFDVDMIDIRGNQGLTVKMEISEPIRAQVFVTGVPHYDPSAGVLQLNNLDVKVNPANLLSKLVTEKIPAAIPLDKAHLSISQEGVTISKLSFLAQELEVTGSVKNLKISSRFG